MTLATHQDLVELTLPCEAPCLSLYLPTHRHHPDNQQDRIRFRGLVRILGQTLQGTHDSDQAGALMKPFEELSGDLDFWNHTLDGLAVFSGPGLFKIVSFQRPVSELAVVADSLHVKPLRRFLQSTDRFQVLAVQQHEIKLYEGNRDSLDPVELAPGVPRTIRDALGDELTEAHQTVASYGGVGAGSTAMRHGHGGKKDEVEKDAERFFRAVDRAVLEGHSRPSGLPLILAALPEHHHLFHQVSQNPQLVEDGIKANPDALSSDDLRDLAWKVVEPHHRDRLTDSCEDFAAAEAKGLGLGELPEIAAAVFQGRVATLLIEADREIAGRIHPGSGNISFNAAGDEAMDDLLDDLGEEVIKKGGKVFVVPVALMPTTTGAAATCRY